MIEVTMRTYLQEQLSGIPVYLEVPADPASTYIVIERTGTIMLEGQVEEATFAIRSVAPTLYEAASLQFSVRDAMLAMVTLPEVASVDVTGIQNWTDDRTKQYRYQGVYDVVSYN